MAWTFLLITPPTTGNYQVKVTRDTVAVPPADLTVVDVTYDSGLRMYVYTLNYGTGGGTGTDTWTLPIIKTLGKTRTIVVRALVGGVEKGRDTPIVQDGRGGLIRRP